jgi:hypothetical protein
LKARRLTKPGQLHCCCERGQQLRGNRVDRVIPDQLWSFGHYLHGGARASLWFFVVSHASRALNVPPGAIMHSMADSKPSQRLYWLKYQRENRSIAETAGSRIPLDQVRSET